MRLDAAEKRINALKMELEEASQWSKNIKEEADAKVRIVPPEKACVGWMLMAAHESEKACVGWMLMAAHESCLKLTSCAILSFIHTADPEAEERCHANGAGKSATLPDAAAPETDPSTCGDGLIFLLLNSFP